MCCTQDNIQPDQLLANSSITGQQLHTSDSGEGQRGINQHGAVAVKQVSYFCDVLLVLQEHLDRTVLLRSSLAVWTQRKFQLLKPYAG